jgi:uncharacterized protein (TIGR02466 family)
MQDISTIPLFAIPISLFKLNEISEEESNKIENILKNIEYNNILKTDNHSSVSSFYNLLNKYEELNNLKKIILDKIKIYSEDIVGNSKTDFQIVSSWSTKTELNQSSDVHRHSNCMYSAVYYNKANELTSSIRFYRYNYNSSFEMLPKKYTVYNSTNWTVQPNNKLLVIFPAYLSHSITKSSSKEKRYSIACNIHPTNSYGTEDSEVNCLGFKSIG